MTEFESREAFHAAASLSRAARDLMQIADSLDRPAGSYSILGNVRWSAMSRACMSSCFVSRPHWSSSSAAASRSFSIWAPQVPSRILLSGARDLIRFRANEVVVFLG